MLPKSDLIKSNPRSCQQLGSNWVASGHISQETDPIPPMNGPAPYPSLWHLPGVIWNTRLNQDEFVFIYLLLVSWNGHFSAFYSLTAGVRQGGVLSPFLFAVFIDGIVDKVQSLNVGCYISTMCCCIFLYADDILLLAPSVSGLQIGPIIKCL